MKILFGFYDKHIDNLCKSRPKDFAIIRKRKSLFNESNYNGITIYDFPSFKNEKNKDYSLENYEQFIHKITWDSVTQMLYERDFLDFKIESLTLRSIKILNYICSCISLLEQIKPQSFFTYNMPHQFQSWVFCCVAEYMGVEIYFVEQSHIPWRYYLVKGIIKPGKLIQINEQDKKNLSKEELKNIETLYDVRRSNSHQSTPAYARFSRKKYSRPIISELINWWKRPDILINKFICIRKYKQLETSEIPSSKDVVFFLHYQPELTTTPRGYKYGQQYHAINLISRSLPKGSYLFVRENIATFKGFCSWKERNINFYNSIHSLPNVKILSLERPAYEIIDNCNTAATISGTVTSEALYRKKKVVIFSPLGPCMIIKNKNLHLYESIENLRNFLETENKSPLTLKDIYLNLESYTMSGLELDGKVENDLNKTTHVWRDLARKKWINFLVKKFDN